MAGVKNDLTPYRFVDVEYLIWTETCGLFVFFKANVFKHIWPFFLTFTKTYIKSLFDSTINHNRIDIKPWKHAINHIPDQHKQIF